MQLHIEPRRIESNDDLDGYARRGVEISRDTANVILAGLSFYEDDLRSRPHPANLKAAGEISAIRRALNTALVNS